MLAGMLRGDAAISGLISARIRGLSVDDIAEIIINQRVG